MKFFKKYYLVLPPVALIYGIYILNVKYPYDGFPQTLMDSIINGWLLIWVLFAALSGGIIYQLQQSKKQQYIYSLPWTKKEIYKKSASWLLISLMIAEIIYGIFFAAKLTMIPSKESLTNIIVCTLLNAAFCFALCAVTHLVVVVTAYIWQGLILAVISIYVMLPIIIQNTAFLIQMVFKIKTYKYAIFEWVIYSVCDRRFLFPLNYQLDISIMDTNLIWKAQYMNTSLICIAAFIAAGILCLWFAKRKFIGQNLAQNRMLTRLSRIENKLIMTVGLSFVIFNAVSNHEINQQVFNYERTLYNRIYELIAWNKDIMENGDSYRMIMQKLSGMHLLIYFAVIFAGCYVAVSLVQTIRRKHYERAC